MMSARPTLLLLMIAALAGPPAGAAAQEDSALAPNTAPAPAPAALSLEPEWVRLPPRANTDVMDRLSPDYFAINRRLVRFLGPRARDKIGLETLGEIVDGGFNGYRDVLEQGTSPFYRLWYSFRPHYAVQRTAFLVSGDNRILAVAGVYADCPPDFHCDDSTPVALHIYVPRGKASADVIDPLRTWARMEGIGRRAPDQIIELP